MDNSFNTKALLVNINREKLSTLAVPIGVCYVAQAARDAGYRIKVLDLCFEKNAQRKLEDAVQEFNPSIIGFSIRNIDTNEWWNGRELLLEEAKKPVKICKSLTNAPIILGGAAVSVMPKEILEYFDCNYAAVGNAEGTFVEILNRIEQKKPFLDVKGLAYFIEGKYVFNQLERYDEFKGVDVGDWIDFRRYKKLGAAMPIQSKRGCALNCIYCVYNKIEGCKYRLRSADEVVSQIESLVKNKNINFFEFVDSTFNIPEGYAKQICQNLISRRVKAVFTSTDVNPLGISLPLLRLMKEAGFGLINISADSASEEMLVSLKKGFNLDCLKKAAESLDRVGFASIWRFMIGGPGETHDSMKKTLKFAKEYLGGKKTVSFFDVGIRIYPGTELEEIAKREGCIAGEQNLLYPVFYISPLLKKDTIISEINKEIKSGRNFALGAERQPVKFNKYFQRCRNLLYFSPNYLQYTLRFLSFPPISFVRHRRLRQIEKRFLEVFG